MKQNGVVCQPGPALLFFIFRFENLISGPKRYRGFRETGPWSRTERPPREPIYETVLGQIGVGHLREWALVSDHVINLLRAKIQAQQKKNNKLIAAFSSGSSRFPPCWKTRRPGGQIQGESCEQPEYQPAFIIND